MRLVSCLSFKLLAVVVTVVRCFTISALGYLCIKGEIDQNEDFQA